MSISASGLLKGRVEMPQREVYETLEKEGFPVDRYKWKKEVLTGNAQAGIMVFAIIVIASAIAFGVVGAQTGLKSLSHFHPSQILVPGAFPVGIGIAVLAFSGVSFVLRQRLLKKQMKEDDIKKVLEETKETIKRSGEELEKESLYWQQQVEKMETENTRLHTLIERFA